MYKLHLILKYLRKRRIAWVSLVAVTLCTAMVLVVISVMGGWLDMFRKSFRGLSGDVLVEAESLTGFPYYQEMVGRIDKLPDVAASVPVIQTFGLVKIGALDPNGVQVIGYPIEQVGKVNTFIDSLYRQTYGKDEAVEFPKDPSLTPKEQREELENRRAAHEYAKDAKGPPSFKPFLSPDIYRERAFRQRSGDPSLWPGMIVGTGVVGIHKGMDNSIMRRQPIMYEVPVTLTLMAIQPGKSVEASDAKALNYWIVDDSRTKVYEYDQKTVYVPFDGLQKTLGMDAQEWTNKTTGKKEIDPARTSAIHVRVKPGISLEKARDEVQKVVTDVLAEQNAVFLHPPTVETWEQKSAEFIDAVEHEKLLLLVLFGIISIVAVFLIFCIFYMIVAEKTRDIGIIKSVGATSAGVAGIFLGYGLAIGIVGAGLGLLIGYLIVHNINWLHTQLGLLLHVQIWNPKVYLFDTIPNEMKPNEVIVIVTVAILSSVLGALVPAIRAARMHPIEALRWE